jgi:phosphoribosyl-ATP pyrophosphohydrolase/phosphoribosyl-AMP cyclohydrolase
MTGDDLVPVVVQDVDSGRVLMLAYGNAESFRKTEETGWMHFWSRSRGRLWMKGEQSGHRLKVVSLHRDCDDDAVLARVRPSGPACHLGRTSCFDGVDPDPIADLWSTIQDRDARRPEGSYVARLLADPLLLRKKVGEEAVELLLTDGDRSPTRVTEEAADLLFHLLVFLYQQRVPYPEVLAELARRRGRPPRPEP